MAKTRRKTHGYSLAGYRHPRNAAPALPAALEAAVLFDFDPVASLVQDRKGIALTDPVGGVVLSKGPTGHYGAEFSGSNYLTGASPFAALSDLTGGVSIYAVCERTDAVVNSQCALSIDEAAGAASTNEIAVVQVGNDPVVAYTYGAGAGSFNIGAVAPRDVVNVLSGHITTTTVEARLGGYSAGSSATTHDPASLDRLLIGANSIFGFISSFWTGRIYRVVVKEGPFEQAFSDYLSSLYIPPSSNAWEGPNADDLQVWWSAESPTESLEGGAIAFSEVGSPASELGTYGGRACHQPASIANGYEADIGEISIGADEAAYLFVMFRNPSSGGMSASKTLGWLGGDLTADRPNLIARTNYSPKWIYGQLNTDTGAGKNDNFISPTWTNDTIHVAHARVTRNAAGTNYLVEGGLDGSWSGSPVSTTDGNFGSSPFTKMSPGLPAASTHPVGAQIFDVLFFKDSGTTINVSGIVTELTGLVS